LINTVSRSVAFIFFTLSLKQFDEFCDYFRNSSLGENMKVIGVFNRDEMLHSNPEEYENWSAAKNKFEQDFKDNVKNINATLLDTVLINATMLEPTEENGYGKEFVDINDLQRALLDKDLKMAMIVARLSTSLDFRNNAVRDVAKIIQNINLTAFDLFGDLNVYLLTLSVRAVVQTLGYIHEKDHVWVEDCITKYVPALDSKIRMMPRSGFSLARILRNVPFIRDQKTIIQEMSNTRIVNELIEEITNLALLENAPETAFYGYEEGEGEGGENDDE